MIVRLALALTTVAAQPAVHGAEERVAGARSVVLVVTAADPVQTLRVPEVGGGEPRDTVLRRYDDLGLSLALLSTAQGRYDRQQALLDISQGSRQPRALLGVDEEEEPLSLDPAGGAGRISGWERARNRARDASLTLQPGVLAGSVPGGAAFVGVTGEDHSAAVAAADTSGRVARVSLGPRTDLVARVRPDGARSRLTVVGLPAGDDWLGSLRGIVATKAEGELILVVNLPPTRDRDSVAPAAPSRFYSQTAIGLSSHSPARELTSNSTRQDGLVTTIDVAPTVLEHLSLSRPDGMRGQTIRPAGEVDVPSLEAARRRWSDVRSGRQAESLRQLALLCLVLGLMIGTFKGATRGLRFGLRTFGLAALWWPVAALGAAVLALQSAIAETVLIAALSVALSVVTGRLIRWPRAPFVPAALALGLVFIDLARGGILFTRSVMGPSILGGSRFYGVSNEIEPVLPILLLTGAAAWFHGRQLSQRAAVVIYAISGALLAVLVGSGRFGADVGGVITVAAAVAAACLRLTHRRVNLRSALYVVGTAVVALGALVVVDLASGAGGHLSNNLNRADGVGELAELVTRRLELSWGVFTDAGHALTLGFWLLAVAFFVRNRATILPWLGGDRWPAALAGGLAGGVAGALTNDSGPVLLTNSILALAAVVAYLAGGPARDAIPGAPAASSRDE